MSENTKIEWATHTFNPWEGCTKVSPGCDHCYAEARNSRFAGGQAVNWGPGAPRRRTSAANWRKPLAWNANHEAFYAAHGHRQRVFCASLADVFDNEVDPAWRRDLFDLIWLTPHLDWLLLTKRIGNAESMIFAAEFGRLGPSATPMAPWPWPNVWLGATIVNQAEANRDIPKLLTTPAAVRFVSMEPLLGPVDLTQIEVPVGVGVDVFNALEFDGAPGDDVEFGTETLDWVIAGGEDGPRPLHPDWARALRDQCAAAGTAFLYKQHGAHDVSFDRDRDDPDCRRCDKMNRLPGRWINLAGGHGFNGERVHYAHRVGKAAAGRLLDGVEHNGFPVSPAARGAGQ